MIRNRPRLFLAAAVAAALASMALADQAGQATAPLPVAPLSQMQASNTSGALRVGDRLDRSRLHPVTRPGLYGMSQPPAGSNYGVLDGNLIRYEPDSAQILSIIRQVDQILD